MKFDNATKVLDVCWRMREITRDRSENRAIILRQFNGDPPFDEKLAEENNVDINRNFLKGVQVLADARRQWNQAFLSTANYFAIKGDFKPVHKRDKWSIAITKRINRYLKKSRAMLENVRSEGANVMLHGIAPNTWNNGDNPIPVPLPIDAVFIPGSTEIDFENMPYFAFFRSYTPSQVQEMISKPKNPGWNIPMARTVIRKTLAQDYKDMGYFSEFTPERIAEEIKADGGYWGSDAVPTIDCLDFYFREEEDGKGWYRRLVLDWDSEARAQGGDRPNRSLVGFDEASDPDKNFLYSSGPRAYCQSLSEILHCQFGDCSAYAPFKYHSVRSLGWLLWGVCDLMNRLECRFFESVFENLMWFFRTSGQNDFNRLRKAVFHHMGVIPSGINFVPAGDRFVPNPVLVDQARGSLRAHIAETAASYTHDFDKGETGRELTATETMARVNSINALLAGMMTLAYNYSEYKYSEIARRIAIGSHPAAVKIREQCMKEDGVPASAFDPERWDVQAERVIGAGNKTVEMAATQFLQNIRKNLGPDAQRKVDNISIRSVTDQPDLADDLAPLDEQNKVSNSTHDAELASERILRGLPFSVRPNMIFEDYVQVWLKDLAMTTQRAMAMKTADLELISGLQNMAKYIAEFLQIMGQNEEEKPKVKQYADALGQIMNHVKALEQQAIEKAQAGNGNGMDPDAVAKLQGKMLLDKAKADNTRESHAQRTAHRQVQFEMEQQRKDQETAAEIERQNAKAASEIRADQIKAVAKANEPKPEKNVPNE